MFASLSFAGGIQAEDIALPVISKPVLLNEGIQRELTQEQIAELLPWAKDSKQYLIDLLDNVQGLSMTDKIEKMTDGFKEVVGESSPKNSELLMRYILNRSLVVNQVLSAEMESNAVGTDDAKLRVLHSSALLAIKYYENDINVLTKKSVSPFAVFGLEYFQFLTEINKSVFDASAQYATQRLAMEWLQWDLYRDLSNARYASQIVKLNNSLKTFPDKKITDGQAISAIRQMKKLSSQLNVKDVLDKLEDERNVNNAKYAEEKARLKREAEYEKMRGVRSEIDIEKVRAFSALLDSGEWTKRQNAANNLKPIVGHDVTMFLLGRLYVEDDSDVRVALSEALKQRVGNIMYLHTTDSLAYHNEQINRFVEAKSLPKPWENRNILAKVLGQSFYSSNYRFLSTWLAKEQDGDVVVSLKKSMENIERNLK